MMRMLTASVLACLCGMVHASDLTLMVGDNPPFNSFRGSRPEGVAVQIVDMMLQRANLSVSYIGYPWARAFNLAQSEKNHCVFTLGRIPEREPLFEWIGPISVNQWVFFGLRERRLALKSLDDARQFTVTGQRKDAKAMWLESQGFSIDYATTESQSLKKVQAGRVDLYPAGLYSLPELAEKAEVDPALFEPLLVFNRVDNYLGCSKSTNPEVLKRLRAALASMKADKSFERITARGLADFSDPRH
ncbi:substrate-binding periplasmic protein [Chitinilyticum litopenaei]|uniref:substrate-binding periplasmic protein n=1 Tax=Chitinilyticum litopenaei TaxID=1121276 RepID=UPI0009DB8A91|nr:transporter substrate-binding domain-containing protein [Chitinilyticum litopenaei]